MIAEDVVANLAESQCFAQAEAVKPGFINLEAEAGVCGRISE